MGMASAWAVAGLIISITAVQVSPLVDPSGAEEAPLFPTALDGAVLPFAAVLAFFTAVALVYARVHNGGGGGNQWIPEPEFVNFALNVSIGLLVACLVPLPRAMEVGGAEVQAPPLSVVAHALLLPSATLTFFMAMALIYAHVRAAGNAPIPAEVTFLTNLTLGATLVSFMTIVLS